MKTSLSLLFTLLFTSAILASYPVQASSGLDLVPKTPILYQESTYNWNQDQIHLHDVTLTEYPNTGRPSSYAIEYTSSVTPASGEAYDMTASAMLELNENGIYTGEVYGERRNFTDEEGDHIDRGRIQGTITLQFVDQSTIQLTGVMRYEVNTESRARLKIK